MSWGNPNWVLFYPEAVALCPTARCVGGTSRYLCECRNPRECKGVQYYQQKEKANV